MMTTLSKIFADYISHHTPRLDSNGGGVGIILKNHFKVDKEIRDTYQENLLDSAALQQHVNSVTHKKGHTLDLIISGSEDNLVSNVCTSVELPSDHTVITCQLDIPRPKALKISMTHRKIKQIW